MKKVELLKVILVLFAVSLLLSLLYFTGKGIMDARGWHYGIWLVVLGEAVSFLVMPFCLFAAVIVSCAIMEVGKNSKRAEIICGCLEALCCLLVFLYLTVGGAMYFVLRRDVFKTGNFPEDQIIAGALTDGDAVEQREEEKRQEEQKRQETEKEQEGQNRQEAEKGQKEEESPETEKDRKEEERLETERDQKEGESQEAEKGQKEEERQEAEKSQKEEESPEAEKGQKEEERQKAEKDQKERENPETEKDQKEEERQETEKDRKEEERQETEKDQEEQKRQEEWEQIASAPATVEGAYQCLYEQVFEPLGDSLDWNYNAKGNFYTVLSTGRGKLDGENFERDTMRSVVYDRVSKNNACHLFVYYETFYNTDGTEYTTAIRNTYAVNMVTGEVTESGKHAWADVGSAAYQEASGEK